LIVGEGQLATEDVSSPVTIESNSTLDFHAKSATLEKGVNLGERQADVRQTSVPWGCRIRESKVQGRETLETQRRLGLLSSRHQRDMKK
jgi:hypothetical protein